MIKAIPNYSILTKTQLVVKYDLEPLNITQFWVLPHELLSLPCSSPWGQPPSTDQTPGNVF